MAGNQGNKLIPHENWAYALQVSSNTKHGAVMKFSKAIFMRWSYDLNETHFLQFCI